jgi:ubiquinol oxidase
LLHVVAVARQEEAHHRDVNHGFADTLAGAAVDTGAHTPYPPHASALPQGA